MKISTNVNIEDFIQEDQFELQSYINTLLSTIKEPTLNWQNRKKIK